MTRQVWGWMLLLTCTVLAIAAAAEEETTRERVHQESAHFTMDSNLPPGFPEAILNLCEADLAGYKDLFGLDVLPPGDTQKIHVFADFKPNSGALWVELKSPMEIHLLVGSDAALNPPGQGGPHNIFGFAHEMAHLVMMFDDSPFDQGFADYFGSEVVDYLQPRLGDKAWPRPYDYVTQEGMPRLKSWVGKADPGGEQAAAVLLYEIAQKHGRTVIGDTVKQLAASSEFTTENESGFDYKAYKVPSFCQVLVKLTGDKSIETLFAERGFGPQPEVERKSIPAAKLWSFPDKDSLDEFLIEQWGGNVEGVVDGERVTMLARFPAGRGWPVKLPTGVTLDAEGGPLSVWYQPATKRAYVLGRVRVSTTGALVENDAIAADGQPLHLNPNASSAAPSTQAAAPQPGAAQQSEAEAKSIPAAKLWTFPDKDSLDEFLIGVWGGNVNGVIDGQPVSLTRFPGRGGHSVQLPSGLTLEAAGGESVSIWYQPATKRAYVFGQARVRSTGVVVVNDAIGPDGQLLHLNASATPAAPSAQPAAPQPEPAASADAEPQNVPSAKLWSFSDKDSLDRFLISQWGGNVEGVIDGQPVTLIRFPRGSARLPWGLVVEAAGGDSLSIWYQPATKRAYIFGRARVSSTGAVVENDAIGPDGQPLHLNPGGPSVATPAPPPSAAGEGAPPVPTGRLESARFVIKSYLPQPFPQAILDLCEASLDGYRDLFGLDLAPKAGERKLRIFADMDASVQGGLWVRPERVPAEIHYVSAADRQLNPPGQGGAHHVFGFAHELGHLVMMFDDPQFGQGFADYLGSEVVDYLQPRLGDKAWPRPYDYVKLDGMARLKTWQSEANPERETAVAVVLYEITQKHGRKVIGEAVTRLSTSAKPVVVRGDFAEDHLAYRVADFCKALTEVTGDKSIERLFAQKIPPARRVTNITSQELWACRSEEDRTKLMEERWGGDGFGTPGLLDGKEVNGFLTGFPPSETGSCHVANGMEMELLGGAWQYGYFQPSTGRSYLIGRFRVLPGGTIVQDDAVDAEGKPLRLNPNAPPAVPVKEVMRTESAHFVLNTNLPDSPVESILRVSEAALDGYQTLFSLDLRPMKAAKRIQLSLLSFEGAHFGGLVVRPEPAPVIWFTDGPSDRTSPAWLQYAYMRGLGELAACFDNDDFQRGFTDYMTAEVMGHVQQRLGEDAWPGAGDRRQVGRVVVSRGKFLATKSGGDGTDKDAAALLARIAQQHGTAAIGAAIRRLQQSPQIIAPPPGVARRYHVDDLRRALVEVTRDSGITALFEESGF